MPEIELAPQWWEARAFISMPAELFIIVSNDLKWCQETFKKLFCVCNSFYEHLKVHRHSAFFAVNAMSWCSCFDSCTDSCSLIWTPGPTKTGKRNLTPSVLWLKLLEAALLPPDCYGFQLTYQTFITTSAHRLVFVVSVFLLNQLFFSLPVSSDGLAFFTLSFRSFRRTRHAWGHMSLSFSRVPWTSMVFFYCFHV